MHPIVFNSHLGYFTLNWCSCAHSKELRPGLYPCGSVTALESVRTEREKHRETWRKVAIKVPTDQSINQQFGLDLPHPLSIPKLSTVSRGNKWHMHEFFMRGPCIKKQDSQSPWRDLGDDLLTSAGAITLFSMYNTSVQLTKRGYMSSEGQLLRGKLLITLIS